MRVEVLPYLLVMALTTYLVRMLPVTFFRKEIRSRFAKSFFYYIPYAVLAAMTFPAVFAATGSLTASLIGVGLAVVLSLCRASLIVVTLSSCVGIWLYGFLVQLFSH